MLTMREQTLIEDTIWWNEVKLFNFICNWGVEWTSEKETRSSETGDPGSDRSKSAITWWDHEVPLWKPKHGWGMSRFWRLRVKFSGS